MTAGNTLAKNTEPILDNAIETNLDTTLEDAKTLLQGMKTVLHDIKSAKELWVTRLERGNDVLARLEGEHQDIALVLIQQAQERVDYYERNKVIQKGKIATLKEHVDQLKASKRNLDKERERVKLYDRVRAMSVNTLGNAETKDQTLSIEPANTVDYRQIQATILATNALIELKKESV